MSEKSQFVCDIFSDISPKYDTFNKYSSFGLYKQWLNEVAKHVCATPDQKMLDVAAGTGDVSFTVSKKCPPQSIVLTDFCKEMLDVAEARYAKGESNGVPMTFQVEDAQNLPFADKSFDIVTVAYGIRNFEDRYKAMSEAYRVLSDGGKYVILEFSTPPNPMWRGMYHVYLKVVIPFLGRMMTKNFEGFTYLRDSILEFPKPDVIVKELESIGFTDVSYVNLVGGIVSIFSARK